jgi:hypothetical protein
MDWRSQRARKTAGRNRPFEAEQPVARVDAAAGLLPALHELPVAGYEANEL